MIFIGLAASILINALFFIFAYRLQTDIFTDLTYSISFLLLSSIIVILAPTPYSYFVAALIGIWAVRLGSYLFIRIHKMGKDSRFNSRRKNIFRFAAFWILQAITAWILFIPIFFASENQYTNSLQIDFQHPFTITGLFLYIAGLLIESIADFQKFKHKQKLKISKTKLSPWIQSGLWKYSRHPNYFGEILLWWGIFFICLTGLQNWQLLSILSPGFITFLLLKVSGIPLLEERYKLQYANNEAFKDYQDSTSLIFPLPPKKSAKSTHTI